MFKNIKVYAFVGPSGTGKSYRAQMVAGEKDVHFIRDDGLLINDNEVIAGESAKKAATKIETVKKALFLHEEERKVIQNAIKKYKVNSILILGTSDGMVEKIAENLGLPKVEETIYIKLHHSLRIMDGNQLFQILQLLKVQRLILADLLERI